MTTTRHKSPPQSGLAPHAMGGGIQSEQRSTLWGLVALTLIWNGFAWGAVWVIMEDPESIETLAFLALLLFPLVGFIFLQITIRSAIRWYKFGESLFQPRGQAKPGGNITGTVHASGAFPTAPQFQLHLSCVRYITSGTGKESRLDSRTLWESAWETAGQRTVSSRMGISIPVDRAIPADAPATRNQNSNDQTIWRLTVNSKTRGVDYRASFVIPVLEAEEGELTS